MKKFITTKHEIEVNDRDSNLCSSKCCFTEKIKGIYHCSLYNQQIDDDGDDDENDDYLFRRVQACLENAEG